MFKRITCLALTLSILTSLCVQQVVAADSEAPALPSIELPAAEAQPEEVKPEGPQLYVNGTPIENAALTYYRGIAYVSLRAVSMALRSDATICWDGNQAIITAEGLYFTVNPNDNYVIANERCLYVPNGILWENGIIYVPARILSKVFDARLSHNLDTQDITLVSGSGALVSADEYYNESDLYWLSHIIYAESGNQPLKGKIAVGNVVMNRTKDPIFPDTIKGVIFQKNQFTPVKNGTINLTPNPESLVAAKLCLEGAVVLPTALWFNGTSRNSWAAKHKTYITTIGHHAFYA